MCRLLCMHTYVTDLVLCAQRLQRATGMRRQQPAALRPHQPQPRLMLATGAQPLPLAALRQQLRPLLRLSTATRRQTSLRPAISLLQTIMSVVASSSCLHQQVLLGPVMCLMSSEGCVILPHRDWLGPSCLTMNTCLRTEAAPSDPSAVIVTVQEIVGRRPDYSSRTPTTPPQWHVSAVMQLLPCARGPPSARRRP